MIVGVDPDPALKRRARLAGRARTGRRCTRYSAGGAYVNMMMHDEGEDRVRASYGDNYDRLLAAKRRYDPDNLLPGQPEHLTLIAAAPPSSSSSAAPRGQLEASFSSGVAWLPA